MNRRGRLAATTWHRSITSLPLALAAAVVYLLHQDFWFWRSARPLVFGFLPIGLFYHAAYTLASSVLLWVIVRRYWPSHLEDPGGRSE
jgi:predicted exporter